MFSSFIHYYVHLTGIVYDTEIFPFEKQFASGLNAVAR